MTDSELPATSASVPARREPDALPLLPLVQRLRDLDLLQDSDNPGDETAMERLLAERLRHYLVFRSEALSALLYRLDIPEAYFRDALGLATLEDTARVLAQGILARERMKQATRERYRTLQNPTEGQV
jgi:hypothetical protein